jgi:lysophospholipase L1-like esterase
VKKNLLLLLASLLLAWSVAEVVVRRNLGAWPWDEAVWFPDHLTERDRPLRWRFTQGEDRNSLGLRGREPGPRAEAVRRVLFLGDSTFFYGETEEDLRLFTDVAEERLNVAAGDEGPSFELINAGVPGYTTYQELEFLHLYGLNLEPDLVVLGFVFNDLHHPYLHRPIEGMTLVADPATHRNRFGTRWPPGRLIGRSYFAHELARVSQLAWRKARGTPDWPFLEQQDLYPAWLAHPWRRTRSQLRTMKRTLAERDIPLVVVLYPLQFQLDPALLAEDEGLLLRPRSRLLAICEALDLQVIDLTDPLTQRGGPALFEDEVHLNRQGNGVVADVVEEELRRRWGMEGG